jgi:hypothetical protein
MKGAVGCVLLVSAICSCAHRSYAPAGWLPSAETAPSDRFGAWAHLRYRDLDERTASVNGELIAVDKDTIYVLPASGALVPVPRALVLLAQAEFYDSIESQASGWAVGGALSTLTHGYYLIITMPAWLVTGAAVDSPAIHAVARLRDEGVFHDQKREFGSLAELVRFTRFPGGLPAGIDRSHLARRPLGPAAERRPLWP